MAHILFLTFFLVALRAPAFAAEPEVSFSCDGSGNLLSFQYGNEPTFEAGTGAFDCAELLKVAESCGTNVDPPRASAAVTEIYAWLAEDPEIRGAIEKGQGAPVLVGARLERARKICGRRGPETGSTFEYSYPFGGYTARNIGHGGKNEMSKEQFRRVAELAVAGGVDPFLAMSVLVTEQTPLASNQAATEAYLQAYGVFPVDGRPAFSFLKCSVEKSELANFARQPGNPLKDHLALLDKLRAEGDAQGGTLNDRFGVLMHQRQALDSAGKREQANKIEKELVDLQAQYQKIHSATIAKIPAGASGYTRQLMEQYVACWRSCAGINAGQCRKESCGTREVPTFDFSSEASAETRTFCASPAVINHGLNAGFRPTSREPGQGDCCFRLRAEPGSAAFRSPAHVTGALGLRTFWDDKMLRALNIVGKRPGAASFGTDDAHKLSRVAQMWNGWGRLNVTEKINTCMGSINLAEKPVTGAKVMDLLVNSTLPNAFLAKTVMEAARKQGKPVKSLLCLYGGAGKKKMPAKAFHQQIASRYLSGTSCR